MSRFTLPISKRQIKLDDTGSNKSRTQSPSQLKSPRYGSSEFFSSLETHIKRLDPEFSFVWGEESPLTQAMNCIKQAIDTILNKSLSLETTVSPKYLESFKRPYMPKAQDRNNINSTEIIKEQQLKIEKDKDYLKEKYDKINFDRENLKKTKKTLFEMEDELRQVKIELNKEQSELNQEKYNFRITKENFEIEVFELNKEKKGLYDAKKNIKAMQIQFNKKIHELQLEKQKFLEEINQFNLDKAKFTQEKRNFDLERFHQTDFLGKINETKEVIVNDLKYFEKERSSVLRLQDELKQVLQDNKEQFKLLENERKEMEALKLSILRQKAAVEKDIVQPYDENNSSGYPLATTEAEITENREYVSKAELQKILSEMHQNFQKVDEEFFIKSSELDQREKKIEETENKLKKKAKELSVIKESLEKSNSELQELVKLTIPSFNSESLNLETLLSSLLEAKSQIQMQNQILEEEKFKVDSLNFLNEHERFKSIQKIIENKFSDVRYKEKELQELLKIIEIKMQELSTQEENIKQKKLDLKTDHEEKLKEIEDCKFQIIELQNKLDLHLQKIETKERSMIETRDQILSLSKQS